MDAPAETLEFFKYRKIDARFIESIVNPYWYFAKPDTLNDPFDCRLDLRGWMNKAKMQATGRQMKFLENVLSGRFSATLTEIENRFKNMGVFCASDSATNQLMWSHYADSHKGVCIKYEFPKSLIEEEKYHLNQCTLVNYDGGEQLLALLAQRKWKGSEIDDDANYNKLVVLALLFSKGKIWSYEKEIRAVSDKPGLVRICSNLINGIYFGVKTGQDEIDLIKKLAAAHTECKSYYRMHQVEGSFDIEARPL